MCTFMKPMTCSLDFGQCQDLSRPLETFQKNVVGFHGLSLVMAHHNHLFRVFQGNVQHLRKSSTSRGLRNCSYDRKYEELIV